MRNEDFLIKAKHHAANEKLNSIFRQLPNFAAGQRVWVYDDKMTISGKGKHVLKAPADGSSRKSFALVSKLTHCGTGPYKVLLVGWGGFPEKPPTASASVQLNVLLGRKGTISRESSEGTSVRPVVGPHSSPTG